MKLAVIDHIGNHGGGSRVVRFLLPALKRASSELRITYFGNGGSIRREGLAEEFAGHGIAVEELDSVRLGNSPVLGSENVGRAMRLVQERVLQRHAWLPDVFSGCVEREIARRVRGYDLAFYPWPFLLPFPHLGCPSVGLFHDFNYKYYFGGAFVFTPRQREQLDRDVPRWMAASTPVVSTRFMADELATFYPQAAARTRVVHLPALGGLGMRPDSQAEDVVRQLGVRAPFVLYPTHLCTHKNVGPLVGALARLNRNGRGLSLVLTGAGTEAVRGHAHDIGVRLDRAGGDVVGLGYVSNPQIDSLIQRAAVVVSPSLYEAGNGPGLDAWGRGTPVAMSDIPPYREHVRVLGVRAQLFDPRSPQDIAEKIAAILDDPIRARQDAEHSRRAISRRTWDHAAAEYLHIFRETAAMSSGGAVAL